MPDQLAIPKRVGYAPGKSCCVYAYEAVGNWVADLFTDGGANCGTVRTRNGRVSLEAVPPVMMTHRETADSVYVTTTGPCGRITTFTAKRDSSFTAPPLDSGGARGMPPTDMNPANTYQARSDSLF